jgi:hypothetical protein
VREKEGMKERERERERERDREREEKSFLWLMNQLAIKGL